MKKQHVNLSINDKESLQKLLSKGTINVRKQKRAMALLELNKGKTYESVCDILNISSKSAKRWTDCYKEDGLNFLEDKPRSGRPTGLSGKDRAKITAIAYSKPPEGYARWSLRLLADKVVELDIVDSISFKQVGLILKKTNCNLTGKGNGVSAK
ncbi:MAG: putative transposase [Polaribacter sp.]|jgi:putative transposase